MILKKSRSLFIIMVLIPQFLLSLDDGICFSSDKDVFFVQNDNNISIVTIKNQIIDDFYVPNNIFGKEYSLDKDFKLFKWKNNTTRIVNKSSGMVYESINDTLKRIDNSFDHKMSFGSHVFKKNDTIFKFGGYGFWSTRNFFNYFNEKTKEWEFYPTKGTLLAPGLYDHKGILIDEDYFVTNGKIMNLFDGFSFEENKEIWKFNFLTKKWTNLGISNLPFFVNYIKHGEKIIVNTLNDKTQLVDFKTNSFEPLERKNLSISIFNKSAFVLNDTLYSFKNGRTINYPVSGLILPRIQTNQQYIYTTPNELYTGLYNAGIFALFIIVCGIFFMRYKQNQMPQTSKLGLRYKGVDYLLKDNENAIMNLILSNQEVFSQKIYDVVENPHLSYPQNNKIKLDTINSLNNKLFKILDIDRFIESKKSKEDQRVLVYFSNHKSVFSKKTYDGE
jgi:hypothetical protein